jgi:hypothetical protein
MYLRQPRHVILQPKSLKYLKQERNRSQQLNTLYGIKSTTGMVEQRNLCHTRSCTLKLNRAKLHLVEVRFPDAFLRHIRVKKEWMPSNLPSKQIQIKLTLNKKEFWIHIMMVISRWVKPQSRTCPLFALLLSQGSSCLQSTKGTPYLSSHQSEWAACPYLEPSTLHTYRLQRC